MRDDFYKFSFNLFGCEARFHTVFLTELRLGNRKKKVKNEQRECKITINKVCFLNYDFLAKS